MNSADDPPAWRDAPKADASIGDARGVPGQRTCASESHRADGGLHDGAATQAGRELALRMEQQGYHPVVLFGASGAGKTTLLASLLAYLVASPADGVRARPGAEPLGNSLRDDEAARDLHACVERFNEGEAPSPTRSATPAFIPIVVESPDGAETRFAFLEGGGIPLHPAGLQGAGGRLPPEISTFLREFPGPISFLYVAPCTLVETWTDDAASRRAEDAALRRAADVELAAAMNAYRAVRVLQHHDAHLVLLTKWDAHAPPGPAWGSFASPDLAEVTRVARERCPRSFAAFLSLGAGTGPHPAQVMQYCSAIIGGRSIVRTHAELQQQIDRYPRVLWSWLHANANRGAAVQKPLFRDQQPRRPRWLGRADRGLATLLRVLGV